jgi:uncharacterized phage-associated protein
LGAAPALLTDGDKRIREQEVAAMTPGDAVILRVLAGIEGAVPATKLVKLVYFVDYVYFQHYGRTLTGFQYQWDHFGPNAVGQAIIGEAENLAERDLVRITCRPNLYGGTTTNFAIRHDVQVPPVPPEAEMVIADVIRQYGKLSISVITAKSKRTAPFKDAAHYSLLSMKQSAPAGCTTEGDWEAYERDLRETGTLSLEQVKSRYKLT